MRARLMFIFAIGNASSVALGQPYAIDSYTIDAGGGMSIGGAYELSGTIGQHDAGGVLTGGPLELVGGFWPGAGAGACNVADFAPPYGTLDFTDVIAFLTAFSTMQPEADLSPPAGVFDFTDVITFLSAFGAGCP